jgi:hypothetical protein
MQIRPAAQSSGSMPHASPSRLLCKVLQSQIVDSLATPVCPARKKQLKPSRGLAQAAAPVGLQVSMGGVHRKTPGTGFMLTSSKVFTEHRLSVGQSVSLRQAL